jgi:hypothetical protein
MAMPEINPNTGHIYGCTISIPTPKNGCFKQTDTVTHEVAHCLGFFGHYNDGGVMKEAATESGRITSRVRNMFSLLYSLPPKTDIRSRLQSRVSLSQQKSFKLNEGKLPMVKLRFVTRPKR